MLKFKYRLPYGRQRLMKDWIKALRSGKYEQGKFLTLSYDGKSCAIGVLGIVACGVPGDGYDICNEFLKIPHYLVCTKNDTEQSFSEIADWLERDYL